MEYRYLGKLHSGDVKSLSYDECKLLASEVRAELVHTVTNNGGHLASNLGVVELTIALHRAFDSPKDRIIFDVSHQCYVHKLLTDRFDRFSTLRCPGGLSGFQKRSESEHDAFGGGHASTSLSAALGFAEADRILGRDNYTIAIAGDGAFTGGMIHEAMNNCSENLRLIFILNENEMSISPNIGGFARYIANMRTKKGYFGVKKVLRYSISSIPGIGDKIVNFLSRQKMRIKNLLFSSNYFEKLGFYYLGPVDGHDIEKTEFLLKKAKDSSRPVILHLKTQKGHGYSPAETDPGRFHGISAQNSNHVPKPRTFSEHFGLAICKQAEVNPRICAITAAMADGTGLVPFSKQFPKRFFDVGIAEEHAMTFAAGLSAAGMQPVFAVYSTFLQRCYDQLIHDVALQDLNVSIAIDRAGIAINDGATHHGIYDVSIAFTIPRSQIWAPLDFKAMDTILPLALNSSGCHFVRYRSGTEFESADERLPYIYKEDFIRASGDASSPYVIITYGHIAEQALIAKKIAEEKGFSLRVLVLEKLRLNDTSLDRLAKLIQQNAKVVFLEEGVQNGGCAMYYQSVLAKYGTHCHILSIPQEITSFREDEHPYKTLGISHEDILEAFGI